MVIVIATVYHDVIIMLVQVQYYISWSVLRAWGSGFHLELQKSVCALIILCKFIDLGLHLTIYNYNSTLH